MPIQISLFNDLIDVLGKVVGADKSMVTLPKGENNWWAQQDSNLRPTDYESAALTN
jgi:hypothetical protein